MSFDGNKTDQLMNLVQDEGGYKEHQLKTLEIPKLWFLLVTEFSYNVVVGRCSSLFLPFSLGLVFLLVSL